MRPGCVPRVGITSLGYRLKNSAGLMPRVDATWRSSRRAFRSRGQGSSRLSARADSCSRIRIGGLPSAPRPRMQEAPPSSSTSSRRLPCAATGLGTYYDAHPLGAEVLLGRAAVDTAFGGRRRRSRGGSGTRCRSGAAGLRRGGKPSHTPPPSRRIGGLGVARRRWVEGLLVALAFAGRQGVITREGLYSYLRRDRRLRARDRISHRSGKSVVKSWTWWPDLPRGADLRADKSRESPPAVQARRPAPCGLAHGLQGSDRVPPCHQE